MSLKHEKLGNQLNLALKWVRFTILKSYQQIMYEFAQSFRVNSVDSAFEGQLSFWGSTQFLRVNSVFHSGHWSNSQSPTEGYFQSYLSRLSVWHLSAFSTKKKTWQITFCRLLLIGKTWSLYKINENKNISECTVLRYYNISRESEEVLEDCRQKSTSQKRKWRQTKRKTVITTMYTRPR